MESVCIRAIPGQDPGNIRARPGQDPGKRKNKEWGKIAGSACQHLTLKLDMSNVET